MTSKAHVIKTRMPVPAPTPEALLAQVHAALEEMKAKDVVEIDVRGRIAEGGDWEAMLPPPVARYIRGHGLYGAGSGAGV